MSVITIKTAVPILTVIASIILGATLTAGASTLRNNGKIAFTSDRDGNREIYVMNPDGTNQTRLTSNLILDDHPTWSSDGKKIAFLSQNASGAFAIFVMNADGTGKTEITPVTYLPQSAYDGFSISWSPDGRHLVFSEYVPVVGTIVVVNADGSNRRNLTLGIHPAWSPDGSKILFLTVTTRSIFTIRPDGTALQNITPSLRDFYSVTGSPAIWSPDGGRIAFGSFDGANQVINIANADGSNPQDFAGKCAAEFVPSGCSSTSFPTWSPNGRTIAFVNFGSQTSAEIYIKDVGGDVVTRLTNTTGKNFNPDWQSVTRQTVADFDGDGRSDISVFRPADGFWYIDRSTQGFSSTSFGLAADRLTPADYDGDGKTDISVYRDGTWFWLNSSNGVVRQAGWGVAGDMPQPADYTGDGRAELAVYRAGTWFLYNIANGLAISEQFGLPNDRPVAADYDGDGRTDFAVYRDGVWYLSRSTQGFAAFQFGIPTDKLVPADYDGDGKTDLAVFRDGTWYLQRSLLGFTAFQFGALADIPVPADYDGNGNAEAAVFRNGVWYLQQGASGFAATPFGFATDQPVPAAYLP